MMLLCFFSIGEASVCLNMIVKDETPVIIRCLQSVRPLIDYWIIVDTGSHDGTQTMIREFFKDIPGELIERPWVNFGHNRNEALTLAKGKADYILFIDADEQLIFSEGFSKPNMDKDFYYITTHYAGTKYERVQLIKSDLEWRWENPVHEVVVCSQRVQGETLKGVYNLVSTDGDRAKDPARFLKDAKLLEDALQENPHHARNVFYLAQSYRDAGEYQKSLETYQQRVAMQGWDQEVFWSLLQVGILQERLGENHDMVAASYLKAYEFRPKRLESLYRLANLYRMQGDFKTGYQYAIKGLGIETSHDLLFVENWIYDYGLLLEYSVCAYWIERYHEALLASLLLLKNQNLPFHVKEIVEKNLYWIYLKLRLQ